MAEEHLISLQPGTVIAGRYEVVKCLGAGSMGMVYACRHRELAGHLVAVKVLFPEVAQDKIAAARFRNEIFASYGVSHPNVVRAYEFIRDGDLVAYTMEYVGGGDLAERLGQTGSPMSVPEVVRTLAQMCLGVQAIHDANIIHRDLKPENILLTKDGIVKIADFGIARNIGHGQRLTEHGGVVGTIDYVSPEYMLNSQVDWRSDIYAMGILGYEMIAGEAPFKGDSVYATMTKRLKSDPPAPSSVRKECPEELDRIILKAMQRDPEQRYQSASEMFRELQAISAEPLSASGAALAGMPAQRKMGSSSGLRPAKANAVSDAKDKDFSRASKPTAATDGFGEEALSLDALKKKDERAEDSSADKSRSEGVVSNLGQSEDDKPRYKVNEDGWEDPAHKRNPTQLNLESANKKAQAPASASRNTPLSASTALNHISDTRKAGGFFSAAGEQDEDIPAVNTRMERTLSPHRSPTLGQSHGSLVRPAGSGFAGGGIGADRFRELSKIADGRNRSLWVDALPAIVALMIGIFVGFAMLKLFAPHLLSKGEAVVVSPQVSREAPREPLGVMRKK